MDEPVPSSTGAIRADEFLRLGDGRRELIAGRVREMTPAGFEHGRLAMRVGWLLTDHVERERLGIVAGAETGFLIRRDPDTVRAPDAAFVARQRVPAPPHAGFLPLAPDLAVEVVSPNDPFSEVEDKARMWLDAGSRMVWVIDPATRRVLVYTPGRTVLDLGAGDQLEGGDVVPGFAAAIDRIFA